MAPVINGRIIFNERPTGYPEPGKTLIYDKSEMIDLETVPLAGGFLIKVLDVSIDPYMRSRMTDDSKDYVPGFILGQPIDNFAIGVVLRSEHPEVEKGDHIYGIMEIQNYVIKHSIKPDSGLLKIEVTEATKHLPWSLYLGVLGMPGQTAYMAWKEYAHAKKGETVFVSTGAGPVGSLVIQLAQRDGLKVIASAGSDCKVDWLKRELGVDVAFNYKTACTSDVLAREGPIDVFWDNVGGETLDAALIAARVHARFIECGMIAGYNSGGAAVKNMFQVVAKSISMQGFIVLRLFPKYIQEFYQVLPPLVASGKIKYTEQVWDGLESVEEAILAVQKGTNKAKAVVRLAVE